MLSIVENIVRFFLNVLIFSLPIAIIYFYVKTISLRLKKNQEELEKFSKLRAKIILTYVLLAFILMILLILLGYIG